LSAEVVGEEGREERVEWDVMEERQEEVWLRSLQLSRFLVLEFSAFV